MIQLSSILFTIALISPPLALVVLSFIGTTVPGELLTISILTSLTAGTVWYFFTRRLVRLHDHAQIILSALEKEQETQAALTKPLQARPVENEPMYQALLALSERLCERRHQMRDTVDKLSTIFTQLTQNKSIDSKAGDFDLPDADDRTLLLGSICQMITTAQQTRQRSDVFATVLRDSPIAMLITDPQLKIKSVNPMAERLLGFSQQQVYHQSFSQFFVPPPLKKQNGQLNKMVFNGEEALEALRNGKKEVFTTINTGYGKVQLVGLRATFGQHCLFVLRERSNEKLEPDHSDRDASNSTVDMPSAVFTESQVTV